MQRQQKPQPRDRKRSPDARRQTINRKQTRRLLGKG